MDIDLFNTGHFWLISDTHFYHKKITEYCNRPANWHERIVNNWREIIQPDDIILHLGDLYFGDFHDEIVRLVNSLPGQKYIILGNHDMNKKVAIRRCGFQRVRKFEFVYDGTTWRFSHWPPFEVEINVCNIHGHSHQNCNNSIMHFDAGVDANDFRPIHFLDVVNKVKRLMLPLSSSITESSYATRRPITNRV